MTFTELEIILGCAAGILLWHIGNQNKLIRDLVYQRDKFEYFLVKIAKGEGQAVVKDDSYFFQEINNETKSISGS